ELQQKVLAHLLHKGKNTLFGKDHNFDRINSYEDFKRHVPVRDYEGLRKYIDRVVKGEKDILWPGKPLYLSKTSGTTSGAKYIPITKDSMPSHTNSTKNALLTYIARTGKTDFVNGKMIFLQGNPTLTKKAGIMTGRLSGIVAHHVPSYLQKNRLPSFETNCIEQWEKKLDKIIDETINEKMTLISGIPSWVQMYFERLQERTDGKLIKDIFPHFSLFVYGGVNYEPYRNYFKELIGKDIDSIELYPASEGFIGFQDKQDEEGMLLTLDAGIFYEFIPYEEFYNDDPTRISLEQVELGVNYAVILNTNAGLWGYNLGDTVKFVSKAPYRIVVTGRVSHFTSAFGEHVIAKEVESSIKYAINENNAEVVEFTVAPQMETENGGRPYHEWLIEFANKPEDMERFRKTVDKNMQEQNIYYKDLIEGNILQSLKITPIQKGGFNAYMKSQGKLGGQNKVPRLADDRKIADELVKWKE
ncbi:MAG: GH3 auxin-responsive promoter family protein, partial [Flavobacteriales bacterium]